MTPDLIRKYAVPVPRYTSYPTAPQFSPDVSSDLYETWLEELAPNSSISLYAHIPFCDTLCWYCGCTTKATRQYTPVADYLRNLINEISYVTSHLRQRPIVRHIHWGGGSPNVLNPVDILRLADALQAYFHVAEDAEFAIEIDPRSHDEPRTRAFAAAGVNRLSVGVQDFDEDVQAAINRIQSYEKTRETISGFRDHGVPSINVDLVYGLPRQTMDSANRTIDHVIELSPDRIALFGYAHLPKRITHQRLINDEDLPAPITRFEIANRLAEKLIAAGYVRIGLDHFARPEDTLSQAPTSRNFQGYTSDGCETLIGLGASAIGKLPQGYVQNATVTHDYIRRVRDDGLAIVRGHALDDEDRMRGFVIERIMCDLEFPARELREIYGARAEPMFETAQHLVSSDVDGLVEADGRGFRVTKRGRHFVRTIASCFDAYLKSKQVLYSVGV